MLRWHCSRRWFRSMFCCSLHWHGISRSSIVFLYLRIARAYSPLRKSSDPHCFASWHHCSRSCGSISIGTGPSVAASSLMWNCVTDRGGCHRGGVSSGLGAIIPGGSSAPCSTPIGPPGLSHTFRAPSTSRRGVKPSSGQLAASMSVQKQCSTEPGFSPMSARSTASQWSVRPTTKRTPRGCFASVLKTSASAPSSAGTLADQWTVTCAPSRTSWP
mmetsp:Transcript_14722/g.35062  ORF Transcript_14722/g.35062 Transcript_14722/m.35062 type:complete len:216 (-) Transcript_14722:134-781(-)